MPMWLYYAIHAADRLVRHYVYGEPPGPSEAQQELMTMYRKTL